MADHPIENLMKTTMTSLKEMIDVNTIVGEPVKGDDGSVIIPISKVSIGFASGGSEFSKDEGVNVNCQYPFGGGSGAGMCVQPVAFLVLREKDVALLPVKQSNAVDRAIDRIPGYLDELMNLIRKNKDKDTGFNPS